MKILYLKNTSEWLCYFMQENKKSGVKPIRSQTNMIFMTTMSVCKLLTQTVCMHSLHRDNENSRNSLSPSEDVLMGMIHACLKKTGTTAWVSFLVFVSKVFEVNSLNQKN